MRTLPAPVVFPSNDRHRLGSDTSLTPISAKELVLPPTDGAMARITHGGGGALTHLMCGFLGTDTPNDPLVGILPSVLKLDVSRGASADWIKSSFRFATLEMARGRVGSPSDLARLAECGSAIPPLARRRPDVEPVPMFVDQPIQRSV